MELEIIRKKIDELDGQLMGLLAERQACSGDVARYKKAHNLPLYQPEREKQMLEAKLALAKKLELDPAMVEKIFAAIIEGSKKIQMKVL